MSEQPTQQPYVCHLCKDGDVPHNPLKLYWSPILGEIWLHVKECPPAQTAMKLTQEQESECK